MVDFSRLGKENVVCKSSEGNSIKKIENIAIRGSKLLKDDEIKFLAKFIDNEMKNKPLTKKFCAEFFKRKEACDKFNN